VGNEVSRLHFLVEAHLTVRGCVGDHALGRRRVLRFHRVGQLLKQSRDAVVELLASELIGLREHFDHALAPYRQDPRRAFAQCRSDLWQRFVSQHVKRRLWFRLLRHSSPTPIRYDLYG
jgi:hypothetical protein